MQMPPGVVLRRTADLVPYGDRKRKVEASAKAATSPQAAQAPPIPRREARLLTRDNI
jgi:hypothetical protein